MTQFDLFNCPSEGNPSLEMDNSPAVVDNPKVEEDNSNTTADTPPTKKKTTQKTGQPHVPWNKISWKFDSPLMQMVHDYQLSIWDDPSDDHLDRSLKQARAFDEYHNHPALDDITSLMVIDFTQHMRKTRKSKASTLNRYLATLSVIFKFAKRHKLMKNAIEIEFFKEPKGRLRTYDLDVVKQMREYCTSKGDSWMADMLGLAVLTGMRRGEILQIGKTAEVQERDGHIVLYLPKTKNGDERWVQLTAQTLEMVRKLEQGHDHFTHRKFYRRWKLMRRDLKLNDGDVFHVLRHTAASILANDLAENAFTIQQMLGHKNINTTKRYVHVNSDAERKASSRLSEAVAI